VRAALVRNVGLLLLATAVIVAIAWVASDRLVLRRIRALVVAARRFGSGDLRARAGPAGGAVELAELASAFDDMADGIGRISEQNRSILDAVGDGIYGLDRRGRVTFVNPAAARMSGYAVEELLGVSMHARLHHSRPDGSPYPPEECPCARTLSVGETRHVDDDVFWRRDGSAFPVEYVAAPIMRDVVVEGAVVAFKDVSERRRAEAELQRQRQMLYQTEKVATMGSLLAGVAHELNNPLAVVLGQTDLLRETTSDPVVRRRADAIKTGAERCARIVKNFLALARHRPPARERISLHQVIRDAVELLGYELRTSGVTVAVELDDAVPAMWADSHQLHQVLVNLLSNARDAMRQSTPRRIVIRTMLRPTADRVRLEVTDTRPGMPAEVQARIFEPLSPSPPARAPGSAFPCRTGSSRSTAAPSASRAWRVPERRSSSSSLWAARRPPPPGRRATRPRRSAAAGRSSWSTTRPTSWPCWRTPSPRTDTPSTPRSTGSRRWRCWSGIPMTSS
jgi:PAS domain S-box-containing protein